MIPFFPIAFVVIFVMEEAAYEKEKRILKNQFQDMILSMSTNLKVGYSPENAFLESYADLLQLYGSGSRIIYELEMIKKGLALNITLDQLLMDFSNRCKTDEITEFVDIFCLAKRTGGNLAEIIESSASLITQKMVIDEEVEVIISAGKMERRIMMVIPFLIILYIEATNKGFFDPLYHNFTGVIVMTVCFLVYFSAVIISGKIIKIRI